MGRHSDKFVQELVERFPALHSLLREHLEDQCGELLPHVFMGDVTRYFVDAYDAGMPRRQEVQAMLDYLDERLAHADDDTQELVAVSFVENLPQEGETATGLRRLMGHALRAHAERAFRPLGASPRSFVHNRLRRE
jgi:hypothetical protein